MHSVFADNRMTQNYQSNCKSHSSNNLVVERSKKICSFWKQVDSSNNECRLVWNHSMLNSSISMRTKPGEIASALLLKYVMVPTGRTVLPLVSTLAMNVKHRWMGDHHGGPAFVGWLRRLVGGVDAGPDGILICGKLLEHRPATRRIPLAKKHSTLQLQ